ncbi:MAG: HNH endonuclease [Actinomycetota bacterium]|nr:HNH endonuclease [Actinomycetota bacterium]
MPNLLETLAEAKAVTSRLPVEGSAFAPLTDDEVMQAQRLLADIGRNVSASAAANAGEIAWRSRPDLGYAGLAQRTGARTPESLVQQLTGCTGREASTLVRVGKVMAEAELLPPARKAENDFTVDGASTVEPAAPWDGSGTAWLAPVGRAVAAGALQVSAADAIRIGLGTPSETVTVAQLTAAAERLVAEAGSLNADQLLKRARALRDEIDADGIAAREAARHAQRSFKVFKRADGMIKGDFLLAPESGGAELLETFELITSPRRGGPRFVDPAEQERAQRLVEDERSTEQISADSLVALLRLGVAADPGAIVGVKKPAVRVLTTVQPDSTGRTGAGTAFGRVEGHSDPVSAQTVDRFICDSGILPLRFDDDGQCLNVGREHRLFTAVQRVALAARNGGCRFPGCDRPASWCEAHHIDSWHRDDGRTDVADGILLCRHHHMLIHNNHWRIRRDRAEYVLIPPKERDPQQTPIPMPSKSLALADLYRRKRAG